MDEKVKIISVFVLLFLLVFIPTVSAVPPVTQVQQYTEGYVIAGTKQEIVKQGRDFQYNFFVYNISTGREITNTTAECFFYMANNSGSVNIYSKVPYYPAGFWGISLAKGNFTTPGIHSYGVKCNSTSLGGTYVSNFEVTPTGEEFSEARAFLYGSLFFVFIFFMVALVFLINSLPASNTKDEEGRILSISYLKYLRPALWFVEWMLFISIMYLSSNIAFAYLGEQLFAKILFTLFRIAFGVTPVIVVVWFVWFFVRIFHDKQLQNMINRGIFPNGKL